MVKMRNLILLLAVMCGLQGLVFGSYYILWNDQDVATATIQVGQTAKVSIGSTDTTAPTDHWWGYALALRDLNFKNLNVWVAPQTIYKARAGASANIYPAAPPYEEQFTLYGLSAPVSAGVWCDNTFSAIGDGTITLAIIRFTTASDYVTEDTLQLTITPAVVPDEPLPPLVAQWEGDSAVVEDVNKVTELTDLSGNGYAMHEGFWYDANIVADYRPTLVSSALNGHDVVKFDGTKFMHYYNPDEPNDPNWINAQGYTWFVVYRADLPADVQPYDERAVFMTGYDDIDSTGAVKWQADGWGMKAHVNFWQLDNYYYEDMVAAKPDGSLAGERVTLGYPWVDGATEPVDSGWRVAVGMWTPATGVNHKTLDGEVDGYLNFGKGAALDWGGSGDTGTTAYLSGHNGTHLGVNSAWLISGSYAKFLTGEVAEVRVYKGGMNLKNRKLVTQHLRMKYGLDICADQRDLDALVADWLKDSGLSMVDFTLDGKVNLLDLAQIALRWIGSGESCSD